MQRVIQKAELDRQLRAARDMQKLSYRLKAAKTNRAVCIAATNLARAINHEKEEVMAFEMTAMSQKDLKYAEETREILEQTMAPLKSIEKKLRNAGHNTRELRCVLTDPFEEEKKRLIKRITIEFVNDAYTGEEEKKDALKTDSQ